MYQAQRSLYETHFHQAFTCLGVPHILLAQYQSVTNVALNRQNIKERQLMQETKKFQKKGKNICGWH